MFARNQLRILVVFVIAALLVSCGAPVAAPATSQPANPPGGVVQPATAAPTSKPPEQPTAAGPARGGTLRVGYGAEIDNLNAFTSQFLTDIELTMVEGLIVSSNVNTYVPVLAKQIPTVENGLVKTRADGKTEMTWQLQQGVMWHDQVHELTSDDVCFTWKYIVSPGSQTYNRNSYLPIIDCKVQDKYTAVMVWDMPTFSYNGLFEAILPKYFLEGKDIVTYDGYNRSPVGTGPFIFVEWKAGQYVRVKRNPNYWRGKDFPYLDEIVFNFIPDTNTRLNALKAGEVDYAEVSTVQIAEAKKLTGYTLTIVPQNSWQYFNTSIGTERGKKIFSDIRVRQAMYYAIDRDGIINGPLEATVNKADSPIPANHPLFNPNVTKYNYDPAKSKALLEEVGWKAGPDGIRVKDGEKFAVTALVSASDNIGKLTLQIIQQNFKAVGIDLQLDTKEAAARTTVWRSGQWEVQVARWVGGVNPGFAGAFTCKGSNNMTSYCDPELDKLLNAATVELDFAKRKVLLDQAQELLTKDAFALPLYYLVNPIATSTKLGNFKASGTNLGSFWNVFEWNLKK